MRHALARQAAITYFFKAAKKVQSQNEDEVAFVGRFIRDYNVDVSGITGKSLGISFIKNVWAMWAGTDGILGALTRSYNHHLEGKLSPKYARAGSSPVTSIQKRHENFGVDTTTFKIAEVVVHETIESLLINDQEDAAALRNMYDGYTPY